MAHLAPPQQSDIALVESATLRRQYADRTDALDKVKALAFLPDGIHMTTDLVARFYEVSLSTIDSLVEANAAELEANGRKVLRGSDLREFATPFGGVANLGLSPKARSIALYDRRAILNVGMLLRDSPIARNVRSSILDATSPTRQLSNRELALMVIAEADRAEAAERAVATLAPKAALADRFLGTGETMYLDELAKALKLTRRRLIEVLRDEGVLYVNELQYRAGYEDWFEECWDWVEALRQSKRALKVTRAGVQGIYNLLVDTDRISEDGPVRSIRRGEALRPPDRRP